MSGMFNNSAWCCFRQQWHLLRVFTSEVSAVKWQSYNKSHTSMLTIVTSCAQQNVIKRPRLTSWKRENVWLSLMEHSFVYISEDTNSFMNRKQSSVTKIFSWLKNHLDVLMYLQYVLLRVQFSAVYVCTDICGKPFHCDAYGTFLQKDWWETLVRNIRCDIGVEHILLSIIQSCTSAPSVLTQSYMH